MLPLKEFNFSPPYGSMARAGTRAIAIWGDGQRRTYAAQKGRNGSGPVPTAKQPDQNSGDRIRIGLPYQNRIITGRVDRQKDVG